MSQPTPVLAEAPVKSLAKPEMKRTREGFGHGLLDLGEKKPNVFVLVGDLSGSTNVSFFAEKYPERFLQVGIAEQNMMCVAAGLAARPLVVSETQDTERNAKAFRNLILNSGDDELIRNLETANTIRLGEDFFRTCVARDDRRHYFCAFIDTSKHPADVDVDGSAEPNSTFKAP